MVKSAFRVIEILELFDRLQRPLTLSEIADTLGYPRSSTMALLHSLKDQDYMSFDALEKQYTPTTRVALLGGWIHGRMFQDGVIVGLMNQLQRESGETVMLALQNGMHAQYVHTVQSQDLLRFYLRPGMLRPICRSAVGLALLAQQSPERVRRLVERINEQKIDPNGAVSYASLERNLETVRQQGYAFSDKVTDDACAIAIVLPARRGQPMTALGVSGPTRRLGKQKEVIYRLMKELASEHLSARFPLRRPVK